MGSFSTVLIEAMLLGRPVLCVNLTSEIDPPPFTAEWGLPPAKSGEELTRRLQGLKAGGTGAYPRVIERFLGPADGSAGRRVAEAVKAALNLIRDPSCPS